MENDELREEEFKKTTEAKNQELEVTKRVVNYDFDDMEDLISKEQAFGYFLIAASRELHYQSVYQLYDDLCDVFKRYNGDVAKYYCSHFWLRRELSEKSKA